MRALLLIPPFCLWHDFFSHAPARPATPGGGRLNIFLAAAAAVSCNTEKIQDGNIGISVAVNVLPCQREMNSWGAREEAIEILQWGDPQENLQFLRRHEDYKHIKRMVLELEGWNKEAAALR